MADSTDPLVLDLVEWIAQKPQPYAHVIDVWRTSCPRLTVWEDACDRGFVKRKNVTGNGMVVIATPAGKSFLKKHGRVPKVH